MRRRDVLRAGLATASAMPALGMVRFPRKGDAGWNRTPLVDPTTVTTLRDPRIAALAHAALDAARRAGAKYADVRMTQSVRRSLTGTNLPGQTVELGVSVRALVDGYWGWAATTVMSADEAVRVARRATEFALHSATRVPGGNVALDTSPVTTTGDWSTPVKVDPFTLDLVELQDWLYGMERHFWDVKRARNAPKSIAWSLTDDVSFVQFGVVFEKQERLFASTEGAFLTQTVISTTPNLAFYYPPSPTKTVVPFPGFNAPVQGGWERVAETPLVSLMERAMDEADALPPPLPEKPIDIGQYDVVFGADAMAQLLNSTLAMATHLDSAIGDEAYAGYASFLGPDPLKFLGTPVASPLVTITAERSNPLGMATVRWDDEGVAPRDFPLVTKGVLENYQTARAQASMLAPWYEKHGQPVRSLGCAMASSALAVTLQHTPNLTLQPGPGNATEASLVAELEDGLHITSIPAPGIPQQTGPGIFRALGADWQYAQGFITPIVATVIQRGKPVSRTPVTVVSTSGDMAIVFRTNELWKNVVALGGKDSLVYAGGYTSTKGDPPETTPHSIGAVPARINRLAVVDFGRMG